MRKKKIKERSYKKHGGPGGSRKQSFSFQVLLKIYANL
jgi:hypothetical protein